MAEIQVPAFDESNTVPLNGKMQKVYFPMDDIVMNWEFYTDEESNPLIARAYWNQEIE